MALEPQIALGVQIPTPENPVQTMTQIESVKALADQRQALAEQRKQQAQKLVEDAQNRAAINEFLSQANGDPMVAGDIATKMGKGEIGQQLYAQATAHRQKIAEAMKSENDLSQAHLDMALKIASTMADSPAHYDAGRQAMAGVIGDDPNLKQWFQSTVPEHPDPAQIPYIVNSLTKVGEDAKTRASQQATNVENFLKGDYNKSLSSQLLSVPKEQRAQVLTVAAQMAPSTAVRNALLQQFAPILGDDDAIAKAGKTPHEQAEESAAKAKADEDAKNKAAELKIQQQNANTAEFRAHNPAATMAPGAQAIQIKPGTAEYRQAQDLADGTLTFADFQRLHSRAQADAPLRAAIYDTARTLNPEFNPAQFELGFKFASNPKVRQQIGSIRNVESGVTDLLKASDAATRSGSPLLNQYAVKPVSGFVLGNKKYSNFKTAVTAFADELSGALGYGSATDMSREMGFDMTDMNQSPDVFKSNLEDIVLPFVARKKASILGQMGVYGQETPGGSTGNAQKPQTEEKTVSLAELQMIAKKNGTTVEQEKARATAAGYVVR